MDKDFIVQVIKYILTGILNTLFGYLIFALIMLTGIHYAAVCVLATIIAVLFNFKTYGNLVFENNDNKRLIRYVSVYIFTMIIGILILRWAKLHGINLYFAGFIITCMLSILSFILLKYYVFRKQKL